MTRDKRAVANKLRAALQTPGVAGRARRARERITERDVVSGRLIVAWRTARGWTQAELGRRLSYPVDPKAISSLEQGHASPTVRTLLNIVRGLDIPGETDTAKLAAFFAGPLAASSTTPGADIRVITSMLREYLSAHSVVLVEAKEVKKGGSHVR